MSLVAGTVVAKFKADVTEFQKGIQKVKSRLKSLKDSAKDVGNSFNNLKSELTGIFTFMAGGLTLVAGGLVMATKKGISFEKMMSSVGAKTQATTEELEKLEKSAREMASITIFSATETAEAMDFMAMAGMNVDEIISGLPGVLSLAQAGNIDLAKSADIATNVMSLFGLEAKDLDKVVDVMAKTVTSSNTDISEMGQALVYIGPTMKAFGVTLEDTSAIIATLADNGIKGSLAGRALGSSIVRLSKPTNAMQGTMSKLNLEFFDMKGEFIGITPMIDMMNDKFKNLTSEQKQSAIATIFGMEAVQEMNILLDKGGSELTKYADGLRNSQGAGNKMAKDMTNNVWGSIKKVGSAFEEIQLKIYDSINSNNQLKNTFNGLSEILNQIGPQIATLAGDTINNLVDKIREWYESIGGADGVKQIIIDLVEDIKSFIDIVMSITGFIFEHRKAILTLIVAYKALKIAMALGALMKSIAVAINLMTIAKGAWTVATWALNVALAVLTSPITLVILAIGALIAIGVLLWKNWDVVKEKASQLGNWLKDVFFRFIDWLKNNWKIIAQILMGPIGIIWAMWEKFGGRIKEFFGGIKDAGIEAFKAMATGIVDKLMGLWNKAQEIADKIRHSIASAFDKEKRNSPSISDRLKDISSFSTKILENIEIPKFSADIAGNLALQGAGSGGEDGQMQPIESAGSGGVQQNINVYPQQLDKNEMDTIFSDGAWKLRNAR